VQEQYTEVTSDRATYSYPYTVEENLFTMPGSGEVLALTDSNGANMVPLHDALGSTLWMVNSSGQMQATFAYSSFGMPSQSGTAYYFPWLFAGMEWSDIGNVSQLYYAGARYYSPGLRRFISPDPMGFAGSGSNLFAYAGNDPVNNTDPTGLDCGGDCGTLGISGAIEGPGSAVYGGVPQGALPPQPGQGWGGQWPVQPFAGPPTSIAGTLMAAQSIQDGATPTRDFSALTQAGGGFGPGWVIPVSETVPGGGRALPQPPPPAKTRQPKASSNKARKLPFCFPGSGVAVAAANALFAHEATDLIAESAIGAVAGPEVVISS